MILAYDNKKVKFSSSFALTRKKAAQEEKEAKIKTFTEFTVSFTTRSHNDTNLVYGNNTIIKRNSSEN